MKLLRLIPVLLVLFSCEDNDEIELPGNLSDAMLALPSQAVAGMSQEGFQEVLDSYDEVPRRLRLSGDSIDVPGDADSILSLRVVEDVNGKTIVATHSARSFADGRQPSESDTFVFRLESGKWVDITNSVLPSDVSRSWWFQFDEAGDAIPCGAYEQFSRQDGLGSAYKFGKAKGVLLWRNSRFHYEPNG